MTDPLDPMDLGPPEAGPPEDPTIPVEARVIGPIVVVGDDIAASITRPNRVALMRLVERALSDLRAAARSPALPPEASPLVANAIRSAQETLTKVKIK